MIRTLLRVVVLGLLALTPANAQEFADCNGNGVPDVDEIGDSGNGTIFTTGIGTPEDIVPSSGDYPPGFLVTDLTTLSVVHVSPLGGTISIFASGFSWPVGATIAPNEFGRVGARLFVVDPVRKEVLVVGTDGEIEPFVSLPIGAANGITYIPEAVCGVAGGTLLVTVYAKGAEVGSVQQVDSSGMVTTLQVSEATNPWTPALAPDDFGQYGNNIFFGDVFGAHLYALDLTANEQKLFAVVPLPPSSGGSLRQLAFSPVGWAADIDPALASERVLLVSVASGGRRPYPGKGFVAVWDQRGKMIAALYKGADELAFEPRGVLFVKNDLLISDIADEHGWLVRVTIEDFGLPDCDHDGILDECAIANGSTDCNENAVPDECEVDCNDNGVPDQCDLIDGTATDCTGSFIPDSCKRLPDCNGNSIPDSCDLESGTSLDCNQNGLSDDCELVFGFPTEVSENTTGFADEFFASTPDRRDRGLAGQAVTFDFGPESLVIDLPGADLSVYEGGPPEFELIDVLVSVDGVTFVSVKSSETSLVRIPGDEVFTNDASGRSYDLGVSGLDAVRFVRIDGNGDAFPDGNISGFDLDAIGAIHLDGDCDGNGVPDACQQDDFDGDRTIDDCDDDIDNDGVANDADDCDFTPFGTPVDLLGRPRGDWDGDCAVTLADYEFLAACFSFSGPNALPPRAKCLTVFDADEDNDVDLKDAALFQRTFGTGQ